MKSYPNLTKTVPANALKGETPEETAELRKMLKEARAYISSFEWCREVKEAYFGLGVGGIVGVYLFNIDSDDEEADEWVWVIVGDLPPAYIAAADARNPACALDGYLGAMNEWVEAATLGQPVDDLIPVNVPATPDNAEKLRVRLDFLEREILSQYSADLDEC